MTQMFCLMLFWSTMEMGRNPTFLFLHLHMRKSWLVLFQSLAESCTCKIWSYHLNPSPCHIANCWNLFALSLHCFLFLPAGTTVGLGSLQFPLVEMGCTTSAPIWEWTMRNMGIFACWPMRRFCAQPMGMKAPTVAMTLLKQLAVVWLTSPRVRMGMLEQEAIQGSQRAWGLVQL